jgi:hypothetical protein
MNEIGSYVHTHAHISDKFFPHYLDLFEIGKNANVDKTGPRRMPRQKVTVIHFMLLTSVKKQML